MLLAYRGNFFNNLLSSVGWSVLTFSTILLLTSRVTSVAGWERSELILLTAVFNIFIGVFHMLFSRNIERFSTIIHYGQLDSILTKPIDSQFLLSFWFVHITSFTRIVAGGIISVLLLKSMHIALSIGEIMGFLLLLIAALAVLYSLWFLIATLTIWATSLSNLSDLLYRLNTFTRFPRAVFEGLPGFIFLFLVPFVVVVNTPTKFLLHKITYWEILELLLLSLILFFASRFFWRFALRFYTSASS